MPGKVKMIGNGRSGKVQYREGWLRPNVCEFYWEIGGGDTLVSVWIPPEDKWDAAYPWAQGRRKEIITHVANEVQKMHTTSTTIQWEKDWFSLVRA